MSILELKNGLKEKIDELQEDYLLKELLNIIDLESNKSEVFKIPKEHKAELEISLNQMDNGETIPHSKVLK